MKIVSYNVNGIRAAINKGLVEWIKEEQPDVLCIQETKAQPEQIPTMELNAIGYDCYCYSAKKRGYSGVAIITKQKPDHIEYGMGIEKYDDEGRMIRADFGDLSVFSVYHPSGTSGDLRQAFKMQWLEDFEEYIENLSKDKPNMIICGDYNICHREIDIHDPKGNAKNSGFLPEEREWIDGFIKKGHIDSFRHIHGDILDKYSWWSYRFNSRARNKGWRIDYCMVTENMEDRIKDADIHADAVHSDHCPVSVIID